MNMNTARRFGRLAGAAIAALVVVAVLSGCGGKETLKTPAADAPPFDGTFKDTRDGKVYKTVKIGSQVWFARNLDYEAKGSVCYDNDDANCAQYGRLYDWKTALKVCPAGWHLPTDDEWTALEDFIGDELTAGEKLKSTSCCGDNVNGTDEYGFSALLGGSGYGSGNFGRASYFGFWWSATEYGVSYAWYRDMYYDNEYVGRNYNDETDLFSVRCVLDDKEGQK